MAVLFTESDDLKVKKEEKMPHDEKLYCKCLIDKYGTNYEKMARDIKLNYFQHTPTQLQKKCERFLALHAGEDLQVMQEIPVVPVLPQRKAMKKVNKLRRRLQRSQMTAPEQTEE